MKIMIIGGGNVGYYLLKTLAAEKHHIMMVESNAVQANKIANELSSAYVEVTWGDGTDVDILRDAGINRMDMLVAVTGQDQDNLVACQLAKDFFHINFTISRVNNPKNIRVFEKLGVDSVISSTAKIAAIINQEIDWGDVNRMLDSKSISLRIREASVEPNSDFANKKLSDLGLPAGVILVTVIRRGEAIIPRGDTKLQVDDEVIIMGKEMDILPVISSFSGK